jgi:fucose 4-O-acetylase-like acetyltransferase
VAYGLQSAGLYEGKEQAFWWLHEFIYSFHMPLFFFLSGLFFLPSLSKHSGNGSFLQEKAALILWPFFLWSLLQLLVKVVMAGKTNHDSSLANLIPGLLWAPEAQFWFLYALFVYFVLALMIVRTGGKHALKIMLILGLGLNLIRLFWEPQYLYFLMEYFIYFALGIALADSMKSLDRRILKIGVVALFLWLGSMLIWYGLSIPQQWIGEYRRLILPALAGIAWLVALSWLWQGKPGAKLLEYLGQQSLPIYLAHIITGSGIRIILMHVGITSLPVHLVAGMVFGIIPPLVMVLICQRLNWQWPFRFPFYGRKKKQALS